MSSITHEMIHASYSVARRIFNREITHGKGLEILVDDFGMNSTSAGYCIQNYRCMMEGRKYSRTINTYGTEYYQDSPSTSKGGK